MGPWQLLGQYGASSCPMVSSRGFQCSPGHAALGNVQDIAPTFPHGKKMPSKWPGEEVLCFPSSIFGLNMNIAKGPCYGPLKLKTSQNYIVYNVYSQFISYWLPLSTVDAILATVVANGQA
jgi:hypothetical protein